MSFYLPNPDVHPTGFEPAEFLDLPPMSEAEAQPWMSDLRGDDEAIATEQAGRLAPCRCGQPDTKPSCDGSHDRVEFRAPGTDAQPTAHPRAGTAP